MFRAGAVDGQDVVSGMQGPTPGQAGEGRGRLVRPKGALDHGLSPCIPAPYGGGPQYVPHLSTTLAGLMRSMVMTGLFRWEPAVSEIPRADPGVLVISTINGPEALATVSGTRKARRV